MAGGRRRGAFVAVAFPAGFCYSNIQFRKETRKKIEVGHEEKKLEGYPRMARREAELFKKLPQQLGSRPASDIS